MTAPVHGIDVENNAGFTVDAERLRHAARTVLAQQGIDPSAGVTIVMVPTILIYVFLSDRMISGITMGGVK